MRGAAAAVSAASPFESPAAVSHQRQVRTKGAARWSTSRGSTARDALAATPYGEAYGDMRQCKVAGCFMEWMSVGEDEARARGQDALADLWNIPRKTFRGSITGKKPVTARRKNAPGTPANKRRRRN